MGLRLVLSREDPTYLDHILSGQIGQHYHNIERYGPDPFSAPQIPAAIHLPENASDPCRSLDLDKFWDVAHYFLSEERRPPGEVSSWEAAYETPASWAVVGAHLSDFGNGDYPVRYARAGDEVEAIVDWLTPVSYESLMALPANSWEQMGNAHVYSFRKEIYDKRSEWLPAVLANLKRFYQQALTAGDAVIYEM